VSMKEADWPLQKLDIGGKEWTGVLSEQICLADDIDASLDDRINTLARYLNVEIKPPIDTAFWSFAFRSVPGLWPVGWGPSGPLTAKKPRGRPRNAPQDIVEAATDLRRKGWDKREAIWEQLSTMPSFMGMTPAAIESAYYRELGKPSPATGNRLALAFNLEDECGEGFCLTPDDELTQTCLQNWSDWMALLVTAWPEQQDILLSHRSFWHRPIILSRYILALRKSV